jgi:hypothetical protein
MLSEIDLKDWDEQPSKPLYDVPKETPIKTHVGSSTLMGCTVSAMMLRAKLYT